MDVNLADSIALKVLDGWDVNSPTFFVAGNKLWPSWDSVSQTTTILLRQCRLNPLQDSKSMPGDIAVNVLHSTPRFKGDHKGLFPSVFFWLIGIFQIGRASCRERV